MNKLNALVGKAISKFYKDAKTVVCLDNGSQFNCLTEGKIYSVGEIVDNCKLEIISCDDGVVGHFFPQRFKIIK